MLDVRRMRVLREVARRGSFSAAAEALAYTQSAVSQQIATLERIVGEKLLERPGGPRPVSLTEAGHLLLRHAESIVARLDAALSLEDGRAVADPFRPTAGLVEVLRARAARLAVVPDVPAPTGLRRLGLIAARS